MNATLMGKSDAGNPYARFDEGKVASAKPRRVSLPYSVRERNNRIEYMVTCVGDFASQYSMTPAQAFAFLDKNGGMSFLINCYDVEHSQSIQTAVDDMAEVCRRNGGVLT